MGTHKKNGKSRRCNWERRRRRMVKLTDIAGKTEEEW